MWHVCGEGKCLEGFGAETCRSFHLKDLNLGGTMSLKETSDRLLLALQRTFNSHRIREIQGLCSMNFID